MAHADAAGTPVLTGVRHVGLSQRAAANAYTNSNGKKRRFELTIITFSNIGAPISAVGIISRQLELTPVIFPIALIFPNSGHKPVAFTRRLSNAWLGTRRRTRPFEPINTHRTFWTGPTRWRRRRTPLFWIPIIILRFLSLPSARTGLIRTGDRRERCATRHQARIIRSHW